MAEEYGSTRPKALKINQDARKFGTFAEIGAGQEVVRWFFHVGKASSTIAKTISAYDMAISNGLYGPAKRYVSRQRLEAMLDHEFTTLVEQLDQSRGEHTAFFVFADTSATQTHSRRAAGHSWLGVRFQTEPRGQPSEIILHVDLLDPVTIEQQEALGLAGVNLIYGAFYFANDPAQLIGSLMDDLSRRRIDINMIKFSGPAFPNVDNRLMSLQLVEQGLTDAAMFTANGEAVEPSEVLYNKPVLMERGSFRPVTNLTLDMLDRAARQLQQDTGVTGDLVAIMEMTLNNLMCEKAIDHRDFLARADILGALGKLVMISNYTRFDKITSYLRQYTQNWIGMPIGIPTLRELFDEKYYTDLEGGILEGLGRLFQGQVRLFIYPTRETGSGELTTSDRLEVKPRLNNLYRYLVDSGHVADMRDVDSTDLHVTPADVLAAIQSGDARWEKLVPPEAAAVIKQEGLFGYRVGS